MEEKTFVGLLTCAQLRKIATQLHFEKCATIRRCRKQDIDPSRPLKEQKWCLYSKSTNKLLGRHPTIESAREQEKAVYANK